MLFNGTNDKIELEPSKLRDFSLGVTIEADIKILPNTNTKGWKLVAAVIDTEKKRWMAALFVVNGTYIASGIRINNSMVWTNSVRGIPEDVVVNVTVTYDNQTIRNYIDSKEVYSTNIPGSVDSFTGNIMVGGSDLSGEFFSGVILKDSVSVLQSALTASEIGEIKVLEVELPEANANVVVESSPEPEANANANVVVESSPEPEELLDDPVQITVSSSNVATYTKNILDEIVGTPNNNCTIIISVEGYHEYTINGEST